jgi:imidazolonepropionase-like amidohydrolase
MRKLFFVLAVVLTGCGSNSDAPKKALVGATLIDGTGAAAIPSSVILIDGPTITFAGTQIPASDGFEKINVTGKYIVPGLIDAHIKLDPDVPTQLKAFLAAGITSVGADTAAAPHVFPSLGKQAGIADLVIASNGSTPEATFAKIERMAKAEIPTLQIIQAATQSSGAWLGQNNLGALKAGQRADLLVLNADPLAKIANLRQIYRVMRDGHWETAPASK